MKKLYKFPEYINDLKKIENEILKHSKLFPKAKVVSLYRGSLGTGTYFSNKFNLPLDILKFQTYDGEDKHIVPLIEHEDKETVFILDDIADSYNTLKKAYEYYYTNGIKNIFSYTLFKKDNYDLPNHFSCHIAEDMVWTVFEHNGERL